jgi:alginate O-acetyltransferase complex protein AlgI
LGSFVFFKYYDFIIANINEATHGSLPFLKDLWISQPIIQGNNYLNQYLNNFFRTDLRLLETIILPIGLSFHTFQAMSYTIEVYRGNQKAEHHFGIYALYVMFYPQLVAGPIERPQNVLPQFRNKKYFNYNNLLSGLRLMGWGLFKKVVIADRLSIYVNNIYDHPSEFHWLNLVIATVFFAIQIYCDFSGYSDIAIGAAKTMGFDLMTNFKRPYYATNIRSFWERWHISLSTWFRDYVYIPLGGSRKGFGRQLLNLAIVFVLSGIWHGANWTFAIWGTLHAFYLVVYLLYKQFFYRPNLEKNIIWNVFSWAITMSAICFAWIFFRASNLSQAKEIIFSIFSLDAPKPFRLVLNDVNMSTTGFGTFSLILVIIALLFMLIIEYRADARLVFFSKKFWPDILFITTTVASIILFGMFIKKSFIYFQF